MTDKNREEYFEYLTYVQLSSQPEPMESYVDWAGIPILSFKDWLALKSNGRLV